MHAVTLFFIDLYCRCKTIQFLSCATRSQFWHSMHDLLPGMGFPLQIYYNYTTIIIYLRVNEVVVQAVTRQHGLVSIDVIHSYLRSYDGAHRAKLLVSGDGVVRLYEAHEERSPPVSIAVVQYGVDSGTCKTVERRCCQHCQEVQQA